jgi:hypothetical protein
MGEHSVVSLTEVTGGPSLNVSGDAETFLGKISLLSFLKSFVWQAAIRASE